MTEAERRQRLVESTSIAEVVGEYTPFIKAVDGLRTLCPFHDDDDRSLHVDPAARRFTCSACSVSGDVVDFVRLFEGLSVSEVFEKLETRECD